MDKKIKKLYFPFQITLYKIKIKINIYLLYMPS